MKIFVGHIRKIFVIVKTNGIIGYWSPEIFKIPACPDILSGILIILLTFLVFSLISTIPWISLESSSLDLLLFADTESSYSS